MFKRNPLILAGLLVSIAFVGIVHAQPKRKPQAKPAVVPKMTATGLLYFAGDGQGIQTCLLKTPKEVIEINVTSKTRVVNFPADGAAWNLGSEWRVTYHKSKDVAFGLEADTVTFTGNSNSAIVAAEVIARDYLTSLSDDSKDYKRAYMNLSAAAKQKIGFADFKKISEPFEFVSHWIRACSYSNERVVLMLIYSGSDNNLYQRVEVMPNKGETFANQFRINRLFDLEKNVDKAEADCRN